MQRKVLAGVVKTRRHLAGLPALRGIGPARRHAFKEGDDCGWTAGETAKHYAGAIFTGCGQVMPRSDR